MTWRTATLGEVTTTIRNGIFARRPTNQPPGSRILRISAVRSGRLDLADAKYVEGLSKDQISRFRIKPGDLLMTRYNGSRALVGTAAIVPDHEGPVIHPDKLIRIVVDPTIADSRFINYQLQCPAVRKFLEPRIRTTAGQSGIAGADVRVIPLAVPDLTTQHQVVATLEDQLSRMDAAESYLLAGSRRAGALVKTVLQALIPDVSRYSERWTTSTVGDAGRVELGRQRHPDWHSGPNMRPYLRVANVFEDRIDLSDLKEMHWPEDTFDRFRLYPGDVLLNEGQSPELLGRPAIYRGDPPEVGFTNTLLRFKPYDNVLPEFALLVFRRHMHAGRFTREARITTNIAHLSASRLKPIEFPIPPLDEQAAIVAEAREHFRAIEALELEGAKTSRRSAALRRSLLAAAFSGRLAVKDKNPFVVTEATSS